MCRWRMLAEIASASDCVATAANCADVGLKCLVGGAVGSVELQAASTASARAVGTAVRRCIGTPGSSLAKAGARLVPACLEPGHPLVRGGAVDRRDWDVHEPQIHRE